MWAGHIHLSLGGTVNGGRKQSKWYAKEQKSHFINVPLPTPLNKTQKFMDSYKWKTTQNL